MTDTPKKTVYLKCDDCGATFGQGEGFTEADALRAAARQQGWWRASAYSKPVDLCPKCPVAFVKIE